MNTPEEIQDLRNAIGRARETIRLEEAGSKVLVEREEAEQAELNDGLARNLGYTDATDALRALARIHKGQQ